jgi:hypothetical protein
MYLKIDKLILIILLLKCITFNAQTYQYSYVDPCTKLRKNISVPMNGTNVSVSYYNNVGVFSYNDFVNGTFDAWSNSVFSQFSNNSPCAEAVGVPTVVNISQNQIINTIGIINSISSLADIVSSTSSTTNMLGGLVNSVTNAPTTPTNSSSENNNNSKSSENGSTNTSSFTPKLSTSNYTFGVKSPTIKMPSLSSSTIGSKGSTSTFSGQSTTTSKPGSTTLAGGTRTTSQAKNNETVKTDNNTNQSKETVKTDNNTNQSKETVKTDNNNNQNTSSETASESEGKTNIIGGGTNTIKMSSNSSSNTKSKSANKEGGKPAIVASGDFVGFNFKNSEKNLGVKGTGGYTSMRWDGKVSQGLMLDYTSAQVGPNLTGFYALMKPKAVSLISATTTVSFDGGGSLYATLAFGQMRMFKKIKSLKILYMGTVSVGHVQKEFFVGTAVITGGMYDFKITKKLDIKMTNLIVYSPYVSYYNDVVMKSPFVILPSLGTTIGLTKRFKFNINFGATWQVGGEALNYTTTSGMRMLL